MRSDSSPLHVLVVDDEPLMAWSLAETLTDHGDIVTEAGTGADAIRALSQARAPIDVVLLDYQLPDVHDLNLLSAVRRLSPDARVILMSAFVTPEIAREAMARGASNVVSKPIEMNKLAAMVHGGESSVVH